MSTELKGWGKVAIGVRIGQSADPLWVRSWSHLLTRGLRPGDTLLDPAIEIPHHFAANLLAKQFLASDADTICFVDCDMIFPPDTLTRLRDEPTGQEYDILSALSVARRYPYAPVVLRHSGEGWLCDQALIDGSVVPVDLMSMGFGMIRHAVFDRMQSKLECGQWYFNWGERGLGEDTSFSITAKQLGFKIGVHTGVSIGHRGQMTMGWNVKDKHTTFEGFDQLKEFAE